MPELETKEIIIAIWGDSHIFAHIDQLHSSHVVQSQIVFKILSKLYDDIRRNYEARNKIENNDYL
jgi:hypothetical protein